MYEIYIIKNNFLKVSVYGSNHAQVGDLAVYSLYVIRVSAVNKVGEGPKSEAFTVRTLASGKLINEPDNVYEYVCSASHRAVATSKNFWLNFDKGFDNRCLFFLLLFYLFIFFF